MALLGTSAGAPAPEAPPPDEETRGMTPLPSHNGVARAIDRAIDQFARVGVLVDDDGFARRRLARELYGTEILPRWWVPVRSARCAVEAFERIFERDLIGRHPCVIALDRHLPIQCGHFPAKPWDITDEPVY